MAQTRKPLFILPNLKPGGAERNTLRLLGDLMRRGFEPTLFLINRQGSLLQDVPTNLAMASALEDNARFPRNALRVMWKLLKCGRESDVIVGALELRSTYLAYLCGRILKRPVVGWVHTSMDKALRLRPRRQSTFTRLVYPRLDRVVALSQGAADSLKAVATLRAGTLEIIPIYLDFESLQAQAAEALPAWAPAILAKPTVVAVARLVPSKGLDVLLRAHARVRASGPDHNLLILGEGSLRTELEAMAVSLEVRDSVFMPGFVANPYPLMKTATAFVSAARWGGLLTALLEALGVGVPAIATNCTGGSGEILGNGKYGLTVPTDDEAALADAMSRMLCDRSLRESLKLTGPARAREFSREDAVSAWEHLLSDVRRS